MPAPTSTSEECEGKPVLTLPEPISSERASRFTARACWRGLTAPSAFVLLAVLSFVGRAWRMAYKITQERGIGAVTADIAWIPIQPLIAAGGLIFVAGFYWDFP